jgi:hypothetical protein
MLCSPTTPGAVCSTPIALATVRPPTAARQLLRQRLQVRFLQDGSSGHAAALIGGELMEGLSIEEAGFEQWLAAERERFRLLTGRIYARLLEQSELSCCSLRARKTTIVFLSSFKRLACQRETSDNAQLPHM